MRQAIIHRTRAPGVTLLFCLLIAMGGAACKSGNQVVNQALHRFLISSAKLGDLPGIRAALRNGVDVNQGDQWDRTALMHAAAAGHFAAVKYLHENGADPGAQSSLLGTSALMSASARGHYHIVEFLIARGAKVDAVETEGRTALMYAIARDDSDIIAMLLKKGADLEHRDKMGLTALTLAVILGHKHIVEFLSARGANVNQRDKEGRSPLDHALERDFAGIALVLRKAGARALATVRARGGVKPGDISKRGKRTPPPKKPRKR